jgi:hypothetical protein
MIDQADGRLAEWARGVLGEEVPVSFAPPGAAGVAGAPDGGLHLYLFELAEGKAPQTTSPQPLRFLLRYLVTATATAGAGSDPTAAHRRLGELLFAALADPEIDVVLGTIPLSLWQTLGAAPQPSFVLQVPLERPRPSRPEVPVREVVLASGPVGEIAGLLLGPGEVPLARARVELPALSRSTVTDSGGRFQLSGVPVGAAAGPLRISARGRLWTLPAPAGPAPLIIRLDLTEDAHGH